MRAWLEFLLRVFPRTFRERFGNEVLERAEAEISADRLKGTLTGTIGLLRTSADLLRAGLAERFRPSWKRPPMARHRKEGSGMKVGEWLREIRLASRALFRSPGFVFATVGTLAVTLGISSAVFGVVDAVLLRPLPYAGAGRLVHIMASAPGLDLPEEFGVSDEFFLHYKEHSRYLEDLATFDSFTASIRVGDRVERLPMAGPSLSLFSTLDATPILGRLPVAEELGRSVVISNAFWTSWFGADSTVLGRSYQIMEKMRTIVGVMGPEFTFPRGDVVLWAPRPEIVASEVRPGQFGVELVGKMTPDADIEVLTAELDGLADQLPEAYGGSARYAELIERHVPVVRPLAESLFAGVSGILKVLMASAVVVLLIACANVANLFTVRSEVRGRDLAVRCAIGAGRTQLLRAQLAEPLVIAALAGAVALLVSWLVTPFLQALVPVWVPRNITERLGPSTVLFTALSSVAAALACGLVPAIHSSSADLQRLRDGGRSATRQRHWTRDTLVVGQTAMGLVLLVASGLLFRSFQELRRVDPGFDPDDVLTFQFAPEEPHLVDGPTWAAFHSDFMGRLRALPGVESVGIVENVPLNERTDNVTLQTRSTAGTEEGTLATATFAGGEYFRTMGIEILTGRGFTQEDLVVPGRVVVSETAAGMLWSDGRDPVGRQLKSVGGDFWYTVVGVVEDVLQSNLRDAAEPLVYFGMVGPNPDSWQLSSPGYVVKSVRTTILVPEIRQMIREVAPSAPMYRIFTMQELVEQSMFNLSVSMMTLGIATVLALLLGALGLYGVLSYVVAERTQEIGVRIALGAQARAVRGMVVAQGARVVGAGVLVGLVAAVAITRVLEGFLFGVAPLDPVTFLAMAVVMLLVGMAASYVPARRASTVDPLRSIMGG